MPYVQGGVGWGGRGRPGCLAVLGGLLLGLLAASAAVAAASTLLLLLLGSGGRCSVEPRRGGLRWWPGGGRGIGRWCTTRCPSGEGLVLRTLLHPAHPAFLQLQVRHELGEGGIRYQGEVAGSIVEILIEVGGERAEEKIITDGLADVAEFVRQLLETTSILVDGLVVLMAGEELLLQEDTPLKFVVGEEGVQLDPHGGGIIAVGDDSVEQIA